MVLTKQEIYSRALEGQHLFLRDSLGLHHESRGCFGGSGLESEAHQETHHAVSPIRERMREDLVIEPFDSHLVNCSGLDFRVGEEIYFSQTSRNIRGVEHLRELAQRGEVKSLKAKNGKVILEPDLSGRNVYYVSSLEEVRLPADLSLLVDAKSSIGRLGAMCVYRNKQVLESGERGHVIVSVQPYAFPLEVEIGKSCLFQAILRYHGSRFMTLKEIVEDNNIQLYFNGKRVLLRERGRIDKEGLVMTYAPGLALRAKLPCKIPSPIEVDAKERYEVKDYFDVFEGDGEVALEPRRFYLLGTRERIKLGNVCGVLSRETSETGTGLWGHFAGFIWQGFDGPLTMECRSESARIISEGDYAGFVRFDKLEKPLAELEGYQGAYQHQKVPMAPKMFKKL